MHNPVAQPAQHQRPHNEPPAAPEPPRSIPDTTFRAPFWVGVVMVAVITAMLAVLIWARGGDLRGAEWPAFYTGLAVVTGLLFWLITPGGDANVSIPWLGAKLGGGAAIGVVFMLIANQLLPAPDLRVYRLPQEIGTASMPRIGGQSEGLEAEIIDRRWLLVHFRDGGGSGEVTVRSLSADGPVELCLVAPRIGNLRRC